jgi:hypothetical protein
MADLSSLTVQGVVDAADTAGVSTVVDGGGGHPARPAPRNPGRR